MCKCIICGKEDYIPDTKKFPKEFCSYKCYEEWQKFNKEPNCKCSICGKSMYIKPSRLNRVKNGITCSQECANKLKSEYMKEEGNHRYGKHGYDNHMFKGETTISNLGYVLEYCPGHPYPHDRHKQTTRVLQHRLVVEQNYALFDSSYFEEIDGVIVLKQEYVVHHKNENRQDNRIENLQIMTPEEHKAWHNIHKKIALVKSDNIGESCDANPEIIESSKELSTSYSVECETCGFNASKQCLASDLALCPKYKNIIIPRVSDDVNRKGTRNSCE